MKQFFTIIAFFLLQNIFAQFQIGHASFDFPDPARSNRSVWGEVYYPATVAGDNKPVAAGQFPVIVFGHGFATIYSEYSVWWENLVPEGYIMVFPRTEGNVFSTSHENFAKDLSFLVTKYKSEGANSSSIFFQKLNNKFGAMGHSMGGGCSVFAAATNPDVTTLCTLAAIQTNAPVAAQTFAPSIPVPALMIAGSADCVANSSQSAGNPLSIYTPMATAPYKAYVEIIGASHCQFGIASFGSNCTQGENAIFNSACSGVTFMPKTAQHSQMLSTSKPWLKYWLKGNNCADWTLFKNDLYNNTGHTFQENGTVSTGVTASISTPGNPTICQGQSITLTASGGATYVWSNGSTSSNVSVNQAGNYSVTATASNGCAAVATKTITVAAAPMASISTSINPVLCQGQNVTLTATGGANYAWSNGSNSPFITVNSSGNYSVVATNSSGCSASSSINVVVNGLPTASIVGNLVICSGQNTTLTANGGSFYQWSNNATSKTITTSQIGTYTVTVTDGNNCKNIASINVITSPSPTASISLSNQNILCEGETLTLIASGGTNYIWSNSGSQNATTVSQSGTYVVTVTNGNGCSATSSKTVVFNPKPVAAISASSSSQLCEGETLTLTASGGTNYIWSNSGNKNATTVSQSGTYVVTVTNGNGCSATSSKTVVFNPKPVAVISASSSSPLCEGENLILTASGGTNYIWSNSGNQNATTVSQSGTYVVTVSNGNGCSATSSKTIVFNPKPVGTITNSGANVFCEGQSTTLTASGGNNYLWSNGAITPSISVSQSGTYAVTVIDSFGCKNLVSQSITVNPSAMSNITASGLATFCEGDSIKLTASGGSTYFWSTKTNQPTIVVKQSGTYTVTVTNTFGCSALASQTVTTLVLPSPNVIASGTKLTCNETAFSYQWYLDGKAIAGATSKDFIAQKSGKYSVEIKNKEGCSSISTPVQIEVTSTQNIDNQLVKIFPNPVSNSFFIKTNQKTRVYIYDVLGKKVYEEKAFFQEKEINTSEWNVGFYFIYLEMEKGFLVKKVEKI